MGLWQLWLAEAVLAEDGMASPAYNPVQGQQLFENIAGIAYIVLVGFFLFKVFSRRAKRAREQVGGRTPLRPQPARLAAHRVPSGTTPGVSGMRRMLSWVVFAEDSWYP